MTTVYLDPIIAACLCKAEQKLGGTEWHPANLGQHELVERLPELKRLLAALAAAPSEASPGMLESIGSNDASVINGFLADHNLDIRLPRFGAHEFGTAAVLDILTKWRVPGAASEMERDGLFIPVVEMKPDAFTVFTVPAAHDHKEVIALATEDASTLVYLTQATDLAAGLRLVRGVHNGEPSAEAFKGLRFPMVDYAAEVDLSWLVGLSRDGCVLSKAVAQAKLRLNEIGAHAKAGVAIRLTRCAGGPRMLVIDKPFVVAFVVAGQVAVAFHVTPGDWRQPPSLGGRKGSIDPADGGSVDTW